MLKEKSNHTKKLRPLENRKIRIVGHQFHSKIPFWQKSADILFLPNIAKEDISKYWTLPMKITQF